MTLKVAINETELMFIERFRIALSAPTQEERLAAIRCARQEVISARLQLINSNPGPDWVHHPENRDLASWVSKTAGEREEATYQFSYVCHAYDDNNNRRLTVAEHIGKKICQSVASGKNEGVQTPRGILGQLREKALKDGGSGARDKGTLRKIWGVYRGVVHLGMALDFCEERSVPPEDVLFVAERYRRMLSENCPKGWKEPYVDAKLQISFSYESDIYGPRFLDRGLPFYVKD